MNLPLGIIPLQLVSPSLAWINTSLVTGSSQWHHIHIRSTRCCWKMAASSSGCDASKHSRHYWASCAGMWLVRLHFWSCFCFTITHTLFSILLQAYATDDRKVWVLSWPGQVRLNRCNSCCFCSVYLLYVCFFYGCTVTKLYSSCISWSML